MVSRSLFLVFALCIFSTLLTVESSYAESGYCSGAEILSIGTGMSGKVIYIKNNRADCTGWPQNAARWFSINHSNTSVSDQMLATALTALSIGKKISVIGPTNYTEWGLLTQIYVSN